MKAKSLIRREHVFHPGGLPPRRGFQKEGIAWSGTYRKLMTTVRETGRRSKTRTGRSQRDRIFHQRVAIRVRYSKRALPGQWKAHGAYIQRESATAGRMGFDEAGQVKPSERLAQWQEAGDELLWKIIISPERGNELDLEQFTKDLLAAIEKDLGLRLEWAACVHKNTEHHHVHLVIRGIDKNGEEVKLPRDYVKQGIRQRAQELATAKLGHRLDYDVILVQTKMVEQARFTDLDREILRRVINDLIYIDPALSTGLRQATEACCRDRLAYLESVGLAKQAGDHTWAVNPNLERVLRALALAHDRQRIMDRFGVKASDPATPIHITRWRDIDRLEGRILVHGQEDQKENAYLLIEDVNGIIRFMEHNKEVDEARAAGRLQPGSYVAMRVKFVGRQPKWIVRDYGPAEDALNNSKFLRACLFRGVSPPDHHLGGWLGQFREAIRTAQGPEPPTQAHHHSR